MKVSELIDLLKQEDQDREVMIRSLNVPEPEAVPVYHVAAKYSRKRGGIYKLESGPANCVVINGDL